MVFAPKVVRPEQNLDRTDGSTPHMTAGPRTGAENAGDCPHPKHGFFADHALRMDALGPDLTQIRQNASTLSRSVAFFFGNPAEVSSRASAGYRDACYVRRYSMY